MLKFTYSIYTVIYFVSVLLKQKNEDKDETENDKDGAEKTEDDAETAKPTENGTATEEGAAESMLFFL
jgi:hypothetical protein